MGTEQWVSASGGAIFLALGVLAVMRGGKSPLGIPLAYLCVAFFAYNTLEVVRHFAHDPVWNWLDGAAASLVAPPTLWLVASFVGRRRELRVPLLAATAYFVGIALLCLVPALVPSFAWFPGSDAWALAF